MQVMIPKEMKSIQDTGQPEFIQDTARYIELMAKEKQPKILVLFTSHDMLKRFTRSLSIT